MKKGATLPCQLACGGVRPVKGRRKRPKFESEGRRALRRIRSKLGHTQHSFAPLLGLVPSTYEKYERGLHKLPPGLLEQAQLLETTAEAKADSLGVEAASLPNDDTLAVAGVELASPLVAETALTAPGPGTNKSVPWEAPPSPSEVKTQNSLGEARYESWVQACWTAQLAAALFIIARIAALELGWTTAWRLGPNDEGLVIAILLFGGLWLLLGQETLRRAFFGLPLRNQRGS